MDILQTLENALLGHDRNVSAEAELQLAAAAKSHFGEYARLLVSAIINEDAKPDVRMLAGLSLKNQLTSKDSKQKRVLRERWLALDSNTRAEIKSKSIQALSTSVDRVAGSAAQLVAAIADIELPLNMWPELIPAIVQNTKPENPAHLKKASHLAIGYICETSDPSNPAIISQANGILIAIIQGVQSSEPEKSVRLAALTALYNSLEFIKYNFEKEGERNYIMQVVCEATQADDSEIQSLAFGCLARIVGLYYEYMSVYMEKALFNLTISGMQSNDEKVACMAVEFWSTVCEEELDITYRLQDIVYTGTQSVESPPVLYNFALVAIQEVIPTLLTLLTKQNEDPEDDDWSVAMAAGACLQLFSQDVGNYIVNPTLLFVDANINGGLWRQKEAAVMAFGSILEGPDAQQLKQFITQALPPILASINDESLHVKETVAWCLGRIADLVVDAIDPLTQLPSLMEALLSGLQDHPKVSTNCCWTLINLLEKLCAESVSSDSSTLSRFYHALIPVLVALSGRGDNESSARASAYEALSVLVLHSANDTLNIVQGVATEALSRLESTIEMQLQVTNAEDKGQLEELQINILSLLTNVIRRIGHTIGLDAADSLMAMFLRLLNNQEPNALIEEDIFIAISAVAGAVGPHFVNYMDAFMPYLTAALQNPDSPTTVTAIGLVADISHSIGQDILPYLDQVMNILAMQLNKEDLPRDLRAPILSCFGDVASSIGIKILPFLDFIVTQCDAAVRLNNTYLPEDEEFYYAMKEAALDCFVGIVTAFEENPQQILPLASTIFSLELQIASDVDLLALNRVVRAAVGLLGDLAAMFPSGELKLAYNQDWVTEFIKNTRQNPMLDENTHIAARWARDQQKRQIQQ